MWHKKNGRIRQRAFTSPVGILRPGCDIAGGHHESESLRLPRKFPTSTPKFLESSRRIKVLLKRIDNPKVYSKGNCFRNFMFIYSVYFFSKLTVRYLERLINPYH